MPDTPEEIAARALDERYPPLAEDHTMTAAEWRRAYFALAEIANGQIDKAYAHIDALTALLREAIEAVHQTGSIRDHADPNDKTGWNVHGIETCEDALCVDALAALEPHDA